MQPTTAPVTAAPSGFVAKIAIVVARKNDPRVVDRMDQYLEPVEIEGDDLKTLLLRSTRYTSEALANIGDPGNGTVAVALDAAVLAGTKIERAGQGDIKSRQD